MWTEWDKFGIWWSPFCCPFLIHEIIVNLWGKSVLGLMKFSDNQNKTFYLPIALALAKVYTTMSSSVLSSKTCKDVMKSMNDWLMDYLSGLISCLWWLISPGVRADNVVCTTLYFPSNGNRTYGFPLTLKKPQTSVRYKAVINGTSNGRRPCLLSSVI